VNFFRSSEFFCESRDIYKNGCGNSDATSWHVIQRHSDCW